MSSLDAFVHDIVCIIPITIAYPHVQALYIISIFTNLLVAANDSSDLPLLDGDLKYWRLSGVLTLLSRALIGF